MSERRIHSVAVLGAGTMGAQIAAHVANAGLPALLLDLDATTARDVWRGSRGWCEPIPTISRPW